MTVLRPVSVHTACLIILSSNPLEDKKLRRKKEKVFLTAGVVFLLWFWEVSFFHNFVSGWCGILRCPSSSLIVNSISSLLLFRQASRLSSLFGPALNDRRRFEDLSLRNALLILNELSLIAFCFGLGGSGIFMFILWVLG